MNKLREKFLKTINIEQCEQITDDFSVKFAEWCDNVATQKSNGLWYSSPLGINIKNPKTTTELLQIFKTQYL